MRKFLSSSLFIIFVACCTHAYGQTADIYKMAGDGYMANRNYTSALDSYNQAIKKSGHEKVSLSTLYYKRGFCYFSLADAANALKDYNKAIELNAENLHAYWERGVLYDMSKEYQLAIDDYNKVILLVKTPGNERNMAGALAILYCNLANDKAALQRYDEALQDDSTSIAANDRYARAYEVRGRIHGMQQKFVLAVDDFTQCLYRIGQNDTLMASFILTSRADNQRWLKKYREAINDYSLSIKLNPKNRVAYWNRGAAYNDNGDYKLAADDYTTAINYYAGDNHSLSKLYDDRASNEAGQNLLSKAIQDDSLAIAYDPENKNAYFNKANAYSQNGDYQAGIDYYNQLIPMYKGEDKILAILYYQIANNEYFLNEFDKVVSDCTQSIKLNPDFSSSYFYRGKVYLKKMNKKQLAADDFNKVISLDTSKKSVDYIFSLFYIGKGDEAVANLQGQVLNTVNDAQLLADYYNLACLYSLMNKPDEANTYLKKALDNGYSKKYVLADEDLDNIRNTDDYKSMMAAPTN